MFSQTVEYSLRAMVALAFRDDGPMTVQQISEVAHVPRPYLSKMMQILARADMVRSQRGLGGGFVLARAPDELTVWDIINAVDPVKRLGSCPLDIEGHGTTCPLHRRIDHALDLIEKAFQETTLREVVEECGANSPLCTSAPAAKSDPAAKRAKRKK